MHPPDEEAYERRLGIRLGLLNGLLIGLVLALGAWALDAIFLFTAPVRLGGPSLLLGALAVVLLGGLGGWLAAWIGRGWAGGLIWLGIGWLMLSVIGHVPYEVRTLLVWVADRRAWGLPVYAFSDAAEAGMWLSGFFILLLLGLLGFLQPYRLEGIAAETEAGGRLGGRGWFMLILPLPLVLAVGLLADNMVNSPLRVAPQLVHEVIRTGRTYEGDLFALSLEEGINYNAIAGLQEKMSQEYTLSLGSIDLGAAEMVYVVADFGNYAWINCRVVMDHVASCYDASPPYFQGFAALLTTGRLPEDCPQCFVRVDAVQREWFQARSGMIGDSPRVGRLAQWGSFVLMQAESSDGEYVLQCLFEGVSPVVLQRCWEVKTGGVAAANEVEPAAPTQPELEPVRLDSAMWDPTDRLGPPAMSDPPTTVELGHYAYYLSCMVCHGEEGQGLEAWRAVLPEEDWDCWQSRCHAASHPPGGFRFPQYAPPVMGQGTLARFGTGAELHGYLHTEMPWQAPGILSDEEYWQITAFLAQSQGADPGTELLTPQQARELDLHPSPGENSP
jgi:hypothetical protein